MYRGIYSLSTGAGDVVGDISDSTFTNMLNTGVYFNGDSPGTKIYQNTFTDCSMSESTGCIYGSEMAATTGSPFILSLAAFFGFLPFIVATPIACAAVSAPTVHSTHVSSSLVGRPSAEPVCIRAWARGAHALRVVVGAGRKRQPSGLLHWGLAAVAVVLLHG